MSKTIGVYLGRFQPLHKAHLEIIFKGLTTEDHFIVILGNDNQEDQRNPFRPEIREKFVVDSVSQSHPELLKKLSVVQLQSVQNPRIWYSNIDQLVIGVINQIFSDKVDTSNFQSRYQLYLYGLAKNPSTLQYLTGVINRSIIKTPKFIDPKFLIQQKSPKRQTLTTDV